MSGLDKSNLNGVFGRSVFESTTDSPEDTNMDYSIQLDVKGVKCPVIPLLAIDGGGTKTIVAITDDKGQILSMSKGGASNYQVVGEENAAKTLIQLIKDAVNNFKKNSCEYYTICEGVTFKRAVFALAGVDTESDKSFLERIIKQIIVNSGIQVQRVIVENDALSVLLGAANRSPGALLISGTGSVAYACDGNKDCVRVGGWGHIVGDEGSGYWIGKQAISSVLKMYDGRESKSILSELVLKHFGFKNLEELHNWIYSPNYSVHDVGSLSITVENACSLGDEVSKDILNRAVLELYNLITTAIKKANISHMHFKLMMLGGILQNNEYVKNKLTNKIKREMTNVEIISTRQKPINLIIQRGLNC